FHSPGRPDPDAATVDVLAARLLVVSEHAAEWKALAERCSTEPVGRADVNTLANLAVDELKPRLPKVPSAGAPWRRRLDEAAAAAKPTLARLSSADDALDPGLALRHAACHAVWAQFLADTFFTLTVQLKEAAPSDEDKQPGYDRHVLSAASRAALK